VKGASIASYITSINSIYLLHQLYLSLKNQHTHLTIYPKCQRSQQIEKTHLYKASKK